MGGFSCSMHYSVFCEPFPGPASMTRLPCHAKQAKTHEEPQKCRDMMTGNSFRILSVKGLN